MKLIYAKGACSLAVHILLNELGIEFQKEEVSLRDKQDVNRYNPNGYVPVLVLDNGDILTEAVVILQYLADQFESKDLFFPYKSMERTQCQMWMNFVTTEIHKSYTPFMAFGDKLPREVYDGLWARMESRLHYLEEHLTENIFLVEDRFTIADMYCFVILRIGEHIHIDYTKFPKIEAYRERVGEIQSVKKAIEDEEGTFIPMKNGVNSAQIHH